MSASTADSPLDPWVRGPVTERHNYLAAQPFPVHPPETGAPGNADMLASHTAVLPVAADAPTGGFSWVGAHGGAGATTFAGSLGGVDVGHAWPDVSRGEPGDMLLLARTHLSGLQSASKALDALRTGRHPAGLNLLALVLVADAPGRLPSELWRRVRVLRSAASTFSIPWIPQWRVGQPAPKAPRSVLELAAFMAKDRPGPTGPGSMGRPAPTVGPRDAARQERPAEPVQTVRPRRPADPGHLNSADPVTGLQQFVYPTPFSPQRVVASVYSAPASAPHPDHSAPASRPSRHV